MFNALSVVKMAVSGVVGLGTGKIVAGIVKNHVTPETLIDKVSIISATWAMAGVASTATKKYTDETIDKVYGDVSEAVITLKTNMKLKRINAGVSNFEDEGLDRDSFVKNFEGKWVIRVDIEDQDFAESYEKRTDADV